MKVYRKMHKKFKSRVSEENFEYWCKQLTARMIKKYVRGDND